MTEAGAISAFFDTEQAFERHSIPPHAAAALYVHGRLLGGQLGHEKAELAQSILGARGIINPECLAPMLMPLAS